MKEKHILLRLIVLLLIVGTPAAVSATEGVTDTEIHIGQFGPLTGPVKLWADCLYGPDIVFKMVNDSGGVAGRKIVYHMIDDSYNPAKTKAAVKQLQESVGIFAWIGGVGTSTGMAVKDYLEKRQVPWVGPLSGSTVWINPPTKSTFALYPHYTFSARELCRYAIEKMGKKHIAIAYLNDGFGLNGLEGAKDALQQHNMQLISVIAVDRMETNMNKIAMDLRAANPDTVILWIDPFKALRLISIAKTMNFSPQWMSGSMLGDFPRMHKLSKGLIEGMITDNYSNFGQPAIKEKYGPAFEKYRKPDATWSNPLAAGIMYAEVLIEGLQRCGKDLTRENFITALESIRNLHGAGPPVSFRPFDPKDPSCRMGINQIYLQQCLPNGEYKQITDWLKDDNL